MAHEDIIFSSLIPGQFLDLVCGLTTSFSKPETTEVKTGRGSGFLFKFQGWPFRSTEMLSRRLLYGETRQTEAAPETIFVVVTCRHVVDYVYRATNPVTPVSRSKREEWAWKLESVEVESFGGSGENRNPAVFGDADFRVLVPENHKLDMALVAIGIRGTSRGLETMVEEAIERDVRYTTVKLQDIADHTAMCRDLEWGTEVGFVSVQPWSGNHPILRSGRISSDPRVNFHSPDIDRQDIYLLEAQSYEGSSGSPVIAYPVGSPVVQSLSMKFPNGGTGRPQPYKPAHLVGIMGGHVREARGKGGGLGRTHVGLSYCHKIEVLNNIVFGKEPLIELETRDPRK